MTAGLAVLELIIGLLYAFSAYALFMTLAGMSTPIWGLEFVLFWGSYFGGAVLLVSGAILSLIRKVRLLAAWLLLIGGALLTAWNAWETRDVPGDVARGTFGIDALVLEVAMIGLVVVADIAAVKIWKRVRLAG